MNVVGRALTAGVAWQITQVISPRETVRVIPREAGGQLALRYSQTHGLDDGIPDGPWAVNLADDQGRYHLLCFDLDAHRPGESEIAHRDAATLGQLLAEVRIRAVTTASSGTTEGGRHVWVALTEPVGAGVVAALTHRLGALLPSLDKAPLHNPGAGCVRPPGAPHRSGRSATLLTGRVEWLTRATTTPEHIAALLDVLDARVADLPAVVAADDVVLAKLPKDPKGHPYLAGKRRALSAATKTALDTTVAGSDDASARLWTIMLGCAAARHHLDDVLTLAKHAPGLEHARTMRTTTRGGRTRRPATGPDSFGAVVRRQWRRACAHVARDPRRNDHTDTWARAAEPITTAIHHIQAAADTTPGRWATGQGPAARRALDALCAWALDGLTLTLDASVRHLGEAATLSHEGARTALRALEQWGLIRFVAEAVGSRAATWELLIHSPTTEALPHAVPRGAPPPPALSTWSALRATLHTRLRRLAHDAWTGRGVGLSAGNQWTNPAVTSDQATKRLIDHHIGPAATVEELDRWADHYQVTGTLQRRIEQHAIERLQYLWWLDEAQRVRDRHRPDSSSPASVRTLGRYPRGGREWRPHHREATRKCAQALAQQTSTDRAA